jgi:hypothetical protein
MRLVALAPKLGIRKLNYQEKDTSESTRSDLQLVRSGTVIAREITGQMPESG